MRYDNVRQIEISVRSFDRDIFKIFHINFTNFLLRKDVFYNYRKREDDEFMNYPDMFLYVHKV